jgi:hypothetical protein
MAMLILEGLLDIAAGLAALGVSVLVGVFVNRMIKRFGKSTDAPR